MEKDDISILLIEDNPGDARLVSEMLKECVGLSFRMTHAVRIDEALKILKGEKFDVVLLDLNLPDSQGLGGIERITAQKPEVPVIIFTSLDDETLGLQAVRKNAGDYLVKGQINSNILVRSIRYAIERKKAEEALRGKELLLEDVIDGSTSPIFLKDRDGKFITINAALEKMLGLSREEIKGKTDYDIAPEEVADNWRTHDKKVMETGQAIQVEEVADLQDGHHIFLANKFPLVDADGQTYGVGALSHDITERKRAEEELRRSRDELKIRVKERTAELEEANKTLQELSLSLISAHEEERKKIAGDLHDTIGSCLGGVKYKIESLLLQMGKDSSVTEESLSSIIPLIQEGIEECRSMQQDLRPSILDDLGLLATLSWFCRRYQTIYTKIKVELEQTLEEKDIPDSLKIVIFRVIQEAMNNIAKHSKADLVHLFFQKMDGEIEIVIEDNGQGFDLKKVFGLESTKRGFGLTSMRERTELSGGSFVIESAEGKGTTLRASWPF